jgi:hypothetical protein
LVFDHWEIIADNLSKAGFTVGWVSALDDEGSTVWIVDAHRDDGKHFIVRADEKLIAFAQLESAISAAYTKEAVGGKKELAQNPLPSQLGGFNNPNVNLIPIAVVMMMTVVAVVMNPMPVVPVIFRPVIVAIVRIWSVVCVIRIG